MQVLSVFLKHKFAKSVLPSRLRPYPLNAIVEVASVKTQLAKLRIGHTNTQALER